MRRLLFVVAFLLLSARLAAQPSLTLGWEMVGETPTVAQANTYRYYLDGAAGLVMTGVVCGVNAQQVTTCQAPIPAPAIGTHTIQMDAENQYGISSKSDPLTFKYPAVPPTPLNLRIVKATGG